MKALMALLLFAVALTLISCGRQTPYAAGPPSVTTARKGKIWVWTPSESRYYGVRDANNQPQPVKAQFGIPSFDEHGKEIGQQIAWSPKDYLMGYYLDNGPLVVMTDIPTKESVGEHKEGYLPGDLQKGQHTLRIVAASGDYYAKTTVTFYIN